jgi:single-strand DNA-binding protein
MSSLNKVMLIGNLGADPELRHTQAGKPVCNMRVATSERWKGGNGEQNERTEWHGIVVWGAQAEACDRYLSKGSKVYVEGKLQTREWEDREGNPRKTTEINAMQVTFLDSSGGGGGGGGGGYGSSSGGDGGSLADKYEKSTSNVEDDIPF